MLVQVRTIIKFENGGTNLARYKSHTPIEEAPSSFSVAARRRSHLRPPIPPPTNTGACSAVFSYNVGILVSGMGPKLEDIDDLMHNIQSRLPIKEAARTSVLSKSWLHAWSTIPTLRFNVLKGKQLKLIDMDRTLIRYLRDNIPIETFNLMIDIENQESASHVAKLIGPMASKPFLKEISLLIFLKGTSFMLPNEILASENLTKIKVSYPIRWNHSVWMTNTPVINCVSLRELRLDGDEGVWERSLFFDAFFEICHPKYVYAMPDVRFKHNNHFFKLMLKEVLDKNTNKTGTACWSHYLKHVRIRRALCKKWKTLKDSHRSLLDGSAPAVSMKMIKYNTKRVCHKYDTNDWLKMCYTVTHYFSRAVQMRTIIGGGNGGTNLGHLFQFAADQFSDAGALLSAQHIFLKTIRPKWVFVSQDTTAASSLSTIKCTPCSKVVGIPTVSDTLSEASLSEDVDELMHNIQSFLPLKEAAGTSVLSKSWLRAWSTIPTLDFDVRRGKELKLMDMSRTVIRYLRDNIPIEVFTLKIDIENQESASHVAENLIGPMASKPYLKKISLLINLWSGFSFMLPDEIWASENLTKIKVSSDIKWNHSIWMTNTPVINCVSLRKLHLEGVCMSEEVLHDILSSCKLLEKISLIYCCKGFKTIRVKNLSRLYELNISLRKVDEYGYFTSLEISDVPNLDVFSYKLPIWEPDMPLTPFNAHSIRINYLTELTLDGVIDPTVITDTACVDKIQSGFPFLGSLTLGMTSWKLASFHFTSASMKIFALRRCPNTLTDVQIYAKNLLSFEFQGDELPTLLFPVSSLMQTKISLLPNFPSDANFFLRMREALTLSQMVYLRISIRKSNVVPMGIDHLRTRLMFPPATNVQSLWFGTSGDEGNWERSPFFDAFFEICHPKEVYASLDSDFKHNNHFLRLMLKEVLDKNTNKTGTACWSRYLKHVRIRRSRYQKWKTLKESHRSLLDGSSPSVSMYFKLNWC
ncbi:hypothetical protein LXL04_036851 [Taraxacum kok-saghyz]